MSYIDIAIIVIVSLGALIGLAKGFFKSIISLFGWLVSFIIAVLLTKVVGEALLDIEFIKGFVLGEQASLFSLILSKLPPLDSTGVIGFLLKPIIEIVTGSAAIAGAGVSLETGVALILTNGIYSVIVCILLFIVIRIVLLLVTMFANAMTAGKFLGAINRLLGFVVGAVKGFGTVCILILIMSFTLTLPIMAPVNAQIEKSVIAKPVSEFVFNMTEKFLKSDENIIDKLLKFAGIVPETPETPETPSYEMTEKEKELNETSANFIYCFSDRESFDTAIMGTDFDKDVNALKAYFEKLAATVKTSGVGEADAASLSTSLKAGGNAFVYAESLMNDIKTLKAGKNSNDEMLTVDEIIALKEKITVAFNGLDAVLEAAGIKAVGGAFTLSPDQAPVKMLNNYLAEQSNIFKNLNLSYAF